MEFSVRHQPHHLDINISGEFTFNYSHKFKRVIELLNEEKLESITLNLKEVGFIDSAGLGMLLLLRDHCLDKNIAIGLHEARGQVAKILALSKFEQLFASGS